MLSTNGVLVLSISLSHALRSVEARAGPVLEWSGADLVGSPALPTSPPSDVTVTEEMGQQANVAPLDAAGDRDQEHGIQAERQCGSRAAQIAFGQLIGAPSDRIDVQFAHHAPVHLQRRDAVVLLEKVAQIVRPLSEGPVEEGVYVAAAGEMIVDQLQVIDAIHDDGIRIGRLQHMIAMELQMLDGGCVREVELLNRVDFVVEYLQRLHLGETGEGVGAYDAQVGLLQRQQQHVGQAAKGKRRDLLEIHVGQLQQADSVHAEERVLLDAPYARRQYQMAHIGEAGERRCLDPDQGIVAQQDQLDVRRARKGVALDPLNLIVTQQNGGQILQSGEGELRHHLQRRILYG